MVRAVAQYRTSVNFSQRREMMGPGDDPFESLSGILIPSELISMSEIDTVVELPHDASRIRIAYADTDE
jgi:hypothetical protein